MRPEASWAMTMATTTMVAKNIWVSATLVPYPTSIPANNP